MSYLPGKRLIAAALVVAAASGLPTAQPAAASCSFNGINGAWRANDGGTYRVRQTGDRVQWIGMSGDQGRSWRHQFRGSRRGDIITGNWADFGAGGPNGRGTLTVRVRDVMHMVRLSNSGSGFGGSRWWRTCNDVVGRPVDE